MATYTYTMTSHNGVSIPLDQQTTISGSLNSQGQPIGLPSDLPAYADSSSGISSVFYGIQPPKIPTTSSIIAGLQTAGNALKSATGTILAPIIGTSATNQVNTGIDGATNSTAGTINSGIGVLTGIDTAVTTGNTAPLQQNATDTGKNLAGIAVDVALYGNPIGLVANIGANLLGYNLASTIDGAIGANPTGLDYLSIGGNQAIGTVVSNGLNKIGLGGSSITPATTDPTNPNNPIYTTNTTGTSSNNSTIFVGIMAVGFYLALFYNK